MLHALITYRLRCSAAAALRLSRVMLACVVCAIVALQGHAHMRIASRV
jgi:hypothetical protein